MQAIIIIGGKSSRFQPLGDKTSFEFLGKSLLEHRMESLINSGFNKFKIVHGDINIEQTKKAIEKFPVDIQLFHQKNPYGMAGAILTLPDESLENESLIVSGNDTVDQILIDDIVKKIKDVNLSKDAIIVGKQMPNYFPGGYIKHDQDNFLETIVEKPGEGNQPSDLVNIVYHYHKKPLKFKKSIQEYLEKNPNSDDAYESASQNLVNNGYKVHVHRYTGDWHPIKFPNHSYVKSQHLIKKTGGQIHSSSQIHPTAIIGEDVIIDENVVVHEYAIIKGYSYIGKGSVVGSFTQIRDSHICQNCLIGSNSEITRSYLGKNSSTHANYLGDTITAENVKIGYGTHTANLKFSDFDNPNPQKIGAIIGANVKIGVDVSIMPGVKIGEGSVIFPKQVVFKDLEKNTILKGDKS